MARLRNPRILLVGAEVTPLAKVGGLGDYIGSLPKALAQHQVVPTVAVPYHHVIDRSYPDLKKIKLGEIAVAFYHHLEVVTIWKTTLPNSTVPLLLFQNQRFLSRGEIYNSKHVWDPVQRRLASRRLRDPIRYLFFSQAVFHWLTLHPTAYQLVHANDWHLAPLLALLKSHHATATIKSLLTIHNVDIGWRGVAKPFRLYGRYVDLLPLALHPLIDWRRVKQQGAVRLFELGIVQADIVNTVSPQYAKELLTRTYGRGLEQLLHQRHRSFSAILNGLDTDWFNPATDPSVPYQYTVRSRVRRLHNKLWLQQRVGFTQNAGRPLLGMVARIVEQKGVDLLLASLPTLRRLGVQIIITGTGEAKLEHALKQAQHRHRSWFYFHNAFDVRFSQQIYAGSDMFLMPSHYEPCGLSQLIAMRYGAVPIVHATGGLKDTVFNGRNGFTFSEPTATAFVRTIDQAVQLYRTQPNRWQRYIKAGMTANYSWDQSALQYVKLYRRVLAKR
ncbi:MAG: glycogen/starch synthase [Candidatus Kerfeldbacteria bacterium]|nr:glycogen/starch synthase [Candidatus Kerfeldbacteria bacterium]